MRSFNELVTFNAISYQANQNTAIGSRLPVSIDDYLADYRQSNESITEFMRQSDNTSLELPVDRLICPLSFDFRTAKTDTKFFFADTIGDSNVQYANNAMSTNSKNAIECNHEPVWQCITSQTIANNANVQTVLERRRISGTLSKEQREERRRILSREYQRRFREKQWFHIPPRK